MKRIISFLLAFTMTMAASVCLSENRQMIYDTLFSIFTNEEYGEPLYLGTDVLTLEYSEEELNDTTVLSFDTTDQIVFLIGRSKYGIDLASCWTNIDSDDMSLICYYLCLMWDDLFGTDKFYMEFLSGEELSTTVSIASKEDARLFINLLDKPKTTTVEPSTEVRPTSTVAPKSKHISSEHFSAPGMLVKNGQIIISPDYECTCPLTVKTSEEMNYYVLLKYIGEPSYTYQNRMYMDNGDNVLTENISFFIEAGKTVDIEVPIGRYELYYATGTTFYGKDKIFGEGRSIWKADKVFDFYTDKDYVYGRTITLYPVSNGNLETKSVPFMLMPKD